MCKKVFPHVTEFFKPFYQCLSDAAGLATSLSLSLSALNSVQNDNTLAHNCFQQSNWIVKGPVSQPLNNWDTLWFRSLCEVCETQRVASIQLHRVSLNSASLYWHMIGL